MDKQWIIEQTDFNTESVIKHNESLFTLGNGYLGLRADLINQGKAIQPGSYINGFYEKGPIRYGEKAYGFAENWQTMIAIPEGKELNISVNGVALFNKRGKFLENRRYLDMRESKSVWTFIWQDENSFVYKGILTTTVPFSTQGTAIFNWELELPEDNMLIDLNSSLYFENIADADSDDPRVSAHFDGKSIVVEKQDEILVINATGSNLSLVSAMDHFISGIKCKKENTRELENGFNRTLTGVCQKNITITKKVIYSYDDTDNKNSLIKNIKNELLNDKSLKDITTEHNIFMEKFWENSDIEIVGDEDAQISLRFNLFQLLQSTGRDGKRSIAAKGLSGLGYEGHYFWDAETYVLPFFIYTNPEIARSMLLYRISIMDKALDRAKVLGHDGILFPWRTINGEESSAYFPAGTAQYHINADIALGLTKYMEVTGDKTILDDGGASLLSGTADFWCSLGSDIPNKGICFNMVTGPDEYTALVDNNYYTNLTAKMNLESAALWLKGVVSDEKVDKWNNIAESIFLPKNVEITPQDDSFLEKEVWDFENTDRSKYPLLLHFHPLNIYRKQVLKQADVVMAQALHRSHFPPGLLKRNFDYYEKLTTRDSSLSACAQGITAFWLGYDELCWEYFLETVHTDRKDLHKNVFHGLHTASMGGAYLMIINGFLGLENYNNTIRFRPKLPKNLDSITLRIRLKAASLKITIDTDSITYVAVNSDVVFYHFSREVSLKNGDMIKLDTKPENRLNITELTEGSLYSVEEEIFNIVNKNCVLPEETFIKSESSIDRIKYMKLGYNS